MSSVWLPGLIVLAVAVAAGLIAARRLGRRAPSDADRRLRIADLEGRRDELYARIRELPQDAPESGERAALELAAARVLKELDELGGSAPPADADTTEPMPAAPPPAAPPPGGGRRAGLIGFATGLAAMAVIALLVYWAGRDAAPGPPPPPQPRGAQTDGSSLPADHPEIAGDLPAGMEERLGALASQLEAAPQDMMVRKELALTQLSAGRYVEAFEQAREIESRIPEDPDALFIQGVVRALMGSNEEALELLDRVLAQYPDHLQALFYRGVALFQNGERERAVDSWQMGLEVAGGQHPEFERVLAMAAEAPAAPPAASSAPPAIPAAPTAPPAASEVPTAQAPAAAGPPISADGFSVRLVLAEGARPNPGSILFVSLRGEQGGPPVAVRRIDSPRFPLDLVIGAADSMMGAELPASGRVTARLDGDGSASTRDPSDLAAEAAARQGEPLILTLDAGS